MKQEPDAYSQFGYYLHRVATLANKRGDEQFRQRLGISLQQFLLLRLVEADRKHAPSQQMIAERLGIAKSAVSRHIDIASKKGWVIVEVSPESRRQNMLMLTDEGKRLLAASREFIKASERQGFGDLPNADVEATVRVLKSLYEKLA